MSATDAERGSAWEVLAVALALGLRSFGGPIAHIGYFRAELVRRRAWIDEATFADLISLAQFLPGAASSKLLMMIGTLRAGLPGAFAAWLGFTMPSAVALVAFAILLRGVGPEAAGWLHGLKVVAVAVVAQAVWGMARSLAWDPQRGALALAAAAATSAWPGAIVQVLVIGAAGLLGWRLFSGVAVDDRPHVRVPIGRGFAVAAGGLYLAVLLALPLARWMAPSQPIAIVDSFYRSGALVFGGGHVVLPLLQAEVVPAGWITSEDFLAGYGAAQAVPGPLFTFAAYLGAAMGQQPNGIGGAALALVAIFVPSFLLASVALGSWGALRARRGVQAALRGTNAAVVGLLLAALYQPVGTSAILRPADLALAVGALGALVVWKLAPWIVVAASAAAGAALSRFL